MLSAYVLRTVGNPVGVEGGGTCFGIKLELGLLTSGRLGVASQVTNDASKSWLFTWSVGAGF